MFNFESTPDPDPLAQEVFLRLSDSPSQYLDADLTRLAAAAAPGVAVTPELMNLLALAGVHICEQAPSVEEADREVVASVCWFAVRTGDTAKPKWLEGRHEGDAWRGRLAVKIRCGLYTAPAFAPYWLARHRLAERIVDKFIIYILKLSTAFGLFRSSDSDPISISLDRLPDEAKFDPAQTVEECKLRMAEAAILAGAPNPEDHEAARTWLFDQLLAGRPWLINLPLAVADHLKHLKETSRLPMLAAPAAPIAGVPPAQVLAESTVTTGEKPKVNPLTGRRIWKAEIDRFQKDEEIEGIEALAKRLAVSRHILGSIKRGDRRHGDATEKEVLQKIGIIRN